MKSLLSTNISSAYLCSIPEEQEVLFVICWETGKTGLEKAICYEGKVKLIGEITMPNQTLSNETKASYLLEALAKYQIEC
jgi:hypothetical protein